MGPAFLDDVDDLGDDRRVGITGHDDRARLDQRWVWRLAQEGPHVAGLVLVHEIAGDVDGDHEPIHSAPHGRRPGRRRPRTMEV